MPVLIGKKKKVLRKFENRQIILHNIDEYERKWLFIEDFYWFAEKIRKRSDNFKKGMKMSFFSKKFREFKWKQSVML